MVVCIIAALSGIPGAGKTTLALKLQSLINSQTRVSSEKCKQLHFQDEKVNFENTIAVIISYDNLIPELSSEEYEGGLWKEWRKSLLQAFDVWVQGSEMAPMDEKVEHIYRKLGRFCKDEEKNMIYIIDDNAYYNSMRYDWFQLCRKYEFGYCEIFLECKVDEAIERNNGRINPVPQNVIESMVNKIEKPDGQVNYWQKNSMIVQSSRIENEINQILNLFASAMKNPYRPVEVVDEEEMEKSRAISHQNILHKCDQVMRKIIRIEMQANKDKNFAQILSTRRNY